MTHIQVGSEELVASILLAKALVSPFCLCAVVEELSARPATCTVPSCGVLQGSQVLSPDRDPDLQILGKCGISRVVLLPIFVGFVAGFVVLGKRLKKAPTLPSGLGLVGSFVELQTAAASGVLR